MRHICENKNSLISIYIKKKQKKKQVTLRTNAPRRTDCYNGKEAYTDVRTDK